MKLLTRIKHLFKREPPAPPTPREWRTVTEEHPFNPWDVFESAKTIVERAVLPAGSVLAPGQVGTVPTPAQRELREKVVFRNGTVITEDTGKKEVTIRPFDGDPIVLKDATLSIGRMGPDASRYGGIMIETPRMRQSIGTNGYFVVEDLTKTNYYGTSPPNRFYVMSDGTVSGTYFPKKNQMVASAKGSITPEGYLSVNEMLVSPLVQRRFIVKP